MPANSGLEPGLRTQSPTGTVLQVYAQMSEHD